MSKKRVSTLKNSTSGSRPHRSTKKRVEDVAELGLTFKRHHFAGIALGGGKSDKTCLAFLEYYPEQNKIFLSELHDKIRTEGELSSDYFLVERLTKSRYRLELLGVNAPLSLPKCLRCKLKCPGYENCLEPEIQWMWDHYEKQVQKKRNHRLFTPYTERCIEQYLTTELEEPFTPQHALGANQAPLWARAQFLKKRTSVEMIEVFPRVSLWRIGRSLNIQKSYLRFHKHQVGGSEARLAILKELAKREVAFLYEQDVRLLVESPQAFEAFICALTAVLKFKGQCEKRPKSFPVEEGWIEIPKIDIIW